MTAPRSATAAAWAAAEASSQRLRRGEFAKVSDENAVVVGNESSTVATLPRVASITTLELTDRPVLAPAPSGDVTGVADTVALQALIDTMPAAGGASIVIGGASELAPYWVTTLKLPAKLNFSGIGSFGTWIKRPVSATGSCIREKTSAEGNAGGATGIVVKGLTIDGNGSAGKGLDLGNQGGASLNFLGFVDDVFSRNFPTGWAIDIAGNATTGTRLFGFTSLNGVRLSGGSNKWFFVDAEQNTAIDLDMSDAVSDTAFGVHAEPLTPTTATDPSVRLGVGCQVHDLSVSMIADRQRIIGLASGATRVALHGIRLLHNGHSATSLLYGEGLATSLISGSVGYVPFWLDGNSTSPAYIGDTTNGKSVVIGLGDSVRPGGFSTGVRPSAATVGSGAMVYDTTLSKPIWSDGTAWRDAAGTTV